MARPPLAMNRFARDAAEDNLDARERLSARMGSVAADLRRCVMARDQAGIALLLCGRARTVPEKHAVPSGPARLAVRW